MPATHAWPASTASRTAIRPRPRPTIRAARARSWTRTAAAASATRIHAGSRRPSRAEEPDHPPSHDDELREIEREAHLHGEDARRDDMRDRLADAGEQEPERERVGQ